VLRHSAEPPDIFAKLAELSWYQDLVNGLDPDHHDHDHNLGVWSWS
jgi:hypothetical protein